MAQFLIMIWSFWIVWVIHIRLVWRFFELIIKSFPQVDYLLNHNWFTHSKMTIFCLSKVSHVCVFISWSNTSIWFLWLNTLFSIGIFTWAVISIIIFDFWDMISVTNFADLMRVTLNWILIIFILQGNLFESWLFLIFFSLRKWILVI